MPPMMCDFCKSHPARSRVTQVENGELVRFFACLECANALSLGLISISAAMESGAKAAPAPAPAETPEEAAQTTCPACGLSYKAFRESMKFGCARCYDAFAPHLARLFSQLQADSRHVGKVPPRVRSAQDLDGAIAQLRARIKEAVGREDFAAAAELRDEVRALEHRRDQVLEGSASPPQDPEASP